MTVQSIAIQTPVVNDPDSIAELDYGRVRESWLNAPTACDRAPDESDATRLYAVSAARHGPWMFVRYVHPHGGVKTMHTEAATNGDGGFYPRALERESASDWPRSVVPFDSDGPDDYYRSPELEWLETLWADHAELREVATA